MGRLQLPLRPSPVPRMPASPTETSAETRKHRQDATLAKTIAKAVAREMEKAHVHYQALLNDRSAATIQTSLKFSSGANGFKVMDPFDWTSLSTRDGNCGQKRLDLPLMPWKVTQKGPKSLTSNTGSMEREWDTLSHGKTAKPHLPVCI